MILGIDPGLSGAVAAVFYDGGLAWVRDLPVVDKNINATEFSHLLREHDISLAVVERVASMPRQGVASVFKFGKGYGQILGVLAAHEIPISEPTPTQWKTAMNLSKDKELSRAMAIKTWPSMAEFFKLKKHDGRAEAALMALWYLRKTSSLPERVDTPTRLTPATTEKRSRSIPRRSIAG